MYKFPLRITLCLIAHLVTMPLLFGSNNNFVLEKNDTTKAGPLSEGKYDKSSSYLYRTTRISIVRGNITEQKVRCIATVVDNQFRHEPRLITQASAAQLQKHCNEIKAYYGGNIKVGDSYTVQPHNLDANGVLKVVLAIVPDQQVKIEEKDKEALLYLVYQKGLLAALNDSNEPSCRTVALPAIAAGVFGYDYDVKQAASVVLDAVLDFIHDHPKDLTEVRLVLLNYKDFEIYKAAFDGLIGQSIARPHVTLASKDIKLPGNDASGGNNNGSWYHQCSSPTALFIGAALLATIAGSTLYYMKNKKQRELPPQDEKVA